MRDRELSDTMERRPIAVFDSGLGGLTVVRALRHTLPNEDIVYFGDTARVPYGTKTRETVLRFTRENCAFLLRLNPKCIVAACNTVSATAVPTVAHELSVPVLGVVTPGATAAVEAAGPGGLVGVIATEATIASNAYRNAIALLGSGVAVVQTSCPLFVPLVEEGLPADDPLIALAISRYLEPLRRLSPRVVVLGCTHYPMLRGALGRFFGSGVTLVDSATSTATAVGRRLAAMNALSTRAERGSLHCYVSDHPRRFQTVGSRFLGEPIGEVVRVCSEELSFLPSRPDEHAASRASA